MKVKRKMGNLITQYIEDNDKRDDVVIDVPPPPPQGATPQQTYDIPSSFSLPEASPEAQELMSNPGNPLMDMSAGDLPEFQMEAPPSMPQDEVITPDFTAIEGLQDTGGLSAVNQFNAGQEEKAQKSFLSELDNNSLQFLTSGETFPTLYEGGGSQIGQLNNRALGLANESFNANKKQQTQDLIAPLAAPRTDLAKPSFNSTQNPVRNFPGMIGSTLKSFGDFLGVTDTSQEFNPVAGVKPYLDSIKKDPWKILSLPIAPALITSQGKFGEQGDGWFGGTMYLLSLPENLITGGLTDLHNIATGNKDPKSNTPNIVQAVLGGNFDITQPVSKSRPFSGIGNDKAPTTITELQNRSGLGKMLLNPWTWDLVRKGKIALTGNENISIPDLKIQDPRDGSIKTVPAGKAVQGIEAGASFVMDVVKGFGSDLIVDAFKGGKKVVSAATRSSAGNLPPATQRIYPQPIKPNGGLPPAPQGLPKVQVIDVTGLPVPNRPQLPQGSIVTPPPDSQAVKLLAPAVKRPNGSIDVPELEVFIRPSTVAPKPPVVPDAPVAPTIHPRMLMPAKDVDEVIQEIRNAPIGTTVDIDALVTVERSTEELTEVAKLLGDVPPTRTKPLSRARLDELSKLYDPARNPYKIHGTPIDVEAFRQPDKIIEINAGEIAVIDDVPLLAPAIDVPMPKGTSNVINELYKRKLQLDSGVDVPEIKQQLIHEADTLLDNLYDTPDIADPTVLAETLRTLPSSFSTTSPVGTQLLQDMLIKQTMYDEVTEAEQVLKPVVINAQKYLAEALEELDELPALGRSSALRAEPFQPSAMDNLPEVDPALMDEVVDDVPTNDVLKNIDTYREDVKKLLDESGIETTQIPKFMDLHPELGIEDVKKILYTLEGEGEINIASLFNPRKYDPKDIERGSFPDAAGMTQFHIQRGDKYNQVIKRPHVGTDEVVDDVPTFTPTPTGKPSKGTIDNPIIKYEDVAYTERDPNRTPIPRDGIKEPLFKYDKPLSDGSDEGLELYKLLVRLDKEGGHNGYVPTSEVRKLFPDLSYEEFNKAINEARGGSKLWDISQTDYHGKATPEQIDGALSDGTVFLEIGEPKNILRYYYKNQDPDQFVVPGGAVPKNKEEVMQAIRELAGDNEFTSILKLREKYPGVKMGDLAKYLYELEDVDGTISLNNFTEPKMFTPEQIIKGSLFTHVDNPFFNITIEQGNQTIRRAVDSADDAAMEASRLKNTARTHASTIERLTDGGGRGKKKKILPLDVQKFIESEFIDSRDALEESIANLRKHGFNKEADQIKVTDDLVYDSADDDLFGDGDDLFGGADDAGLFDDVPSTPEPTPTTAARPLVNPATEAKLRSINPDVIKRYTNEDRIIDGIQKLELQDLSTPEVPISKIMQRFPKMEPQKLVQSLKQLEADNIIEIRGGVVERVDIPINYDTYYHGTQVKDFDINTADPLLGGSRNELGVGIYVTTNKQLAENSARALPQNNLPPLEGRNFDEVGTVIEFVPDVRKPVFADKPPSPIVHDNFMDAVRQTQPDEVYQTVKKKLGKATKNYNTYYTTLDEAVYNKLGTINEADVLQTQRVIQDGLRMKGYDAISDGDVLVLLGNPNNNSVGVVESISKLGNGTLLEGAAARYNVAQITAAKYPKNQVLEIQAKEAGIQLQTEMAKRVTDMYDAALTRAEDVATSLSRSQDELENLVQSEKKLKKERKARTAARKNKNQIENDSRPDTNHCL